MLADRSYHGFEYFTLLLYLVSIVLGILLVRQESRTLILVYTPTCTKVDIEIWRLKVSSSWFSKFTELEQIITDVIRLDRRFKPLNRENQDRPSYIWCFPSLMTWAIIYSDSARKKITCHKAIGGVYPRREPAKEEPAVDRRDVRIRWRSVE